VPLVTHSSPPLSELATTMMKLSQNLYAETLLKTLGVSVGMPSAAGGIAAVRSVLDKWNVPATGYTQVDGSGLSRYNYTTAETLVAVLEHVDHDPRLRDPFRATLPIAGRPGTLDNRMKGTAAEGNARAKTGSLTNAHALSGYVSSADGEPLVFSIVANNFGVPSEVVDRTADAIVVRLANFRR
jgi:D-alanyl-D-alanine carboxypeptidase/D-alanyl-D-alanine-endopeptidase (penicillin-binding protein 4)